VTVTPGILLILALRDGASRGITFHKQQQGQQLQMVSSL